MERAWTAYRRFGRYLTQLKSVRQRLEREPVARRELDRICGDLGIPGDADRFVRQYVKVNKEDVWKNRNGLAERLGFIGRVMHGPRTWQQELRGHIGSGGERMVEPESIEISDNGA